LGGGFLKNEVYKEELKNVEELKTKIKECCKKLNLQWVVKLHQLK